jgi:hypothetical protein
MLAGKKNMLVNQLKGIFANNGVIFVAHVNALKIREEQDLWELLYVVWPFLAALSVRFPNRNALRCEPSYPSVPRKSEWDLHNNFNFKCVCVQNLIGVVVLI